MELIALKANKREDTGKSHARTLRREGRIPAVLYGPDTNPLSLSVSIFDIEQVLKQGASAQLLLNLAIENDEKPNRSAMMKELHRHPLSRDFLHVDFYEVSMDRKIKVKIPVELTGKSKGIELGGILQLVRRELEIMCLPQDVPKSIVIDVTELDVGDSVHVNEIPLEGDAEIIADVNFTVITVVMPKKEAEPEVEEGEEGEEGAEEGAEGDESEAAAGAEE